MILIKGGRLTKIPIEPHSAKMGLKQYATFAQACLELQWPHVVLDPFLHDPAQILNISVMIIKPACS